MKFKTLLGASALAVTLVACVTNPITGRKSIQISNDAELQQMALQEYKATLSKSKLFLIL